MRLVLPRSRFAILGLFFVINLVSFALLRIALLVKQWADIDTPIVQILYAFVMGVIYDSAFYAYLLIPFTLYLIVMPQRWYAHSINKIISAIFFLISLYGLFFLILAEWTFWDEFGVRFNFIAVDYLIYTHEVVQNIVESYPLGKLLTGVFVITVSVFLMIRRHFSVTFHNEETFSRRIKIAGFLLLLPVISYFSIHRTTHQFSQNTYLNEIAANGGYQFFSAFRNNELNYRQFYRLADDVQLSQKIKIQLSATNDSLYDIKRQITADGPEKKLNIILITVESLSADYLTKFGNKNKITPFMDNWFHDGALFTNFYATGTRTIRGLEALTLSIPPTAGQSIVKRPDNERLFNLGHVLQERGYDTAFLYGGMGYFDNMNAFYEGNGYRIVDQNQFTSEEVTFKNAWGVSDDIIFNRTIKEADNDFSQDKPFFFQIMTTTNHRPYSYPEGKIDIPSGKSREGAVKYTDYAIQEFIKTAKTKPWFDNTIFVMVADHCAGSARKTDLPVDKYHIPLFIYAPKHVPIVENKTLSSQIDVAPTLLGLLNLRYESQFYGQDILKTVPEKGRALISNYQKLGLFKDNKLVYLSPQQKIDVVDDPLGEHHSVAPETQTDLVNDVMSYYQSADYIWTHRLSRY
ncbi:MAG: LTA synthase family protein [Methylococcales bacterium]|nr:LTA synthase family protein [Methylococcales bacterium]